MPPFRTTTPSRILLAEADDATALLIDCQLSDQGFAVHRTNTAAATLAVLNRESFDIDLVIVNARLPDVAGIELLLQLRRAAPNTRIIALTAQPELDRRAVLITAGADEYLAVPCPPEMLLTSVRQTLARAVRTDAPATPLPTIAPPPAAPSLARTAASDLPILAVTASTGGPDAMERVLRDVDLDQAYGVAVLHGPSWLLTAFAARLASTLEFQVELASHGAPLRRGTLYLAPGDRHMRIGPDGCSVVLDEGPLENHVRPAADPLFCSVAQHFGANSVAAVLSGLGRDGLSGARLLAAVGARLFVQDPSTCAAPFMPRALLEAGLPCHSQPLEGLGAAITAALAELSATARVPAAR